MARSSSRAVRTAAALVATTAVACGTTFAHAQDAGLYLYRIPADLGGGDVPRHETDTYFDLYLPDQAALVESLAASPRINIVGEREGAVRIRLSQFANEPIAAGNDPKRATFVVDYEQAPIGGLLTELQAEYGAQPAIGEVVEFVDRRIATKTYRHGFRIASEVARTLEGDCTEHAVLTAALLRAVGTPARLALGVLVIAEGDTLRAYGHAWAEAHDDQAWRVADATRPELAAAGADIHHIALYIMSDEGPGYSMELMGFLGVRPARLTVISSSE